MKLLLPLLICILCCYSLAAQPGSNDRPEQKSPLVGVNVDTVPDIDCLVFKVTLNAIQLFDPETHLNSAIINFTIPGLLTTLEPVELRLLIDHHFPPQPWIRRDSLTRDELFAAAVYRSFGKDRLSINGQLFSGTIRLYSHSYWYDLSRRAYPSLSLMINTYSNGALQKTIAVQDIGALCYDIYQVRPA